MLSHTSNSLEAPVNRCEWDSRWEMRGTENETAYDKSWGQNAKVTTVMSFTAPEKIPGVCDTATILSTLHLFGKLNLSNSISLRSPSNAQIRCNWLNAVHDLGKIKGFGPLQREIRIKWSTWNPKKVTNVLLKFTWFQLPSFLFYLGFSLCVSYIEKRHLCHEPLASGVSPCSRPADRKHSRFLWHERPNWVILGF